MTVHAFRGCLSLLALWLSACGAAQSLPPTPLQLVLGGATSVDGAFVPLVDGQDATLVEGAQGGFHVWMKYRLHGLTEPQHFLVEKRAWRKSDGQLVLRAMGWVDAGTANPQDDPDGGSDAFWELPEAMPMFMCPSPIGIRIVDEPIVFQVTLIDEGGGEAGMTAAQDQVLLVPRCPTTPDDKLAFCMSICTG